MKSRSNQIAITTLFFRVASLCIDFNTSFGKVSKLFCFFSSLLAHYTSAECKESVEKSNKYIAIISSSAYSRVSHDTCTAAHFQTSAASKQQHKKFQRRHGFSLLCCCCCTIMKSVFFLVTLS